MYHIIYRNQIANSVMGLVLNYTYSKHLYVHNKYVRTIEPERRQRLGLFRHVKVRYKL